MSPDLHNQIGTRRAHQIDPDTDPGAAMLLRVRPAARSDGLDSLTQDLAALAEDQTADREHQPRHAGTTLTPQPAAKQLHRPDPHAGSKTAASRSRPPATTRAPEPPHSAPRRIAGAEGEAEVSPIAPRKGEVATTSKPTTSKETR